MDSLKVANKYTFLDQYITTYQRMLMTFENIINTEAKIDSEIPQSVFDAYQVLQIDPSVSDLTIIKAKYKLLAKIYHPDKGGSTEKMKKINVAYEIIEEYLK